MERAGYWLHKWTDETSSFDPHGRWSGGLDCYERDYSMWIPDRIKPDDTVAVNDYIDRQFELSAEVADGLEVIDAADAQATIVALQADNRTYINERHDNMKQIEQLQADLAERTAELEAVNKHQQLHDRIFARQRDLMAHYVATIREAIRRLGNSTHSKERPEPYESRTPVIAAFLGQALGVTAEEAERERVNLQAELERVRGELVEAKDFLNTVTNDLNETAKERDDLRALVAALPKVEGEIRLIHADDGDWHVVDLYDAIFTDKSWAVSYAALLQHRQGME